LNDAIDPSEWRDGLDGRPQPPWQLVYLILFLDPETAAKYASINSTVGQRRAYDELVDRISSMRKLRGNRNIHAMVRFSSASMSTQFGIKPRPRFEVTGWRDLGAPSALAEIGKPVEGPSSSELIGGDGIPGEPEARG
jgi:hypothetical protein